MYAVLGVTGCYGRKLHDFTLLQANSAVLSQLQQQQQQQLQQPKSELEDSKPLADTKYDSTQSLLPQAQAAG